jgi:branched-chain amino acid transport system permease protein
VEALIQNIINALSLSSLYALIALGMAIIFGIMRLMNFAQGDFIMVGGYAIVILADLPWPLKVLATLLVVVALALAVERLAFRPVRDSDPATLLVTSFAVAFLLQNLALIIFGSLAKATTLSPFLLEVWRIGDLAVPKRDVVMIITTLLLLAGLVAFLDRTATGVQMRAASEDFRMTQLLGVNANKIVASAFAVSGLLAAVAGLFLVSTTGTVSWNMGLNPLLVGFIASVIGGLGSLRGAVLGGFALGTITVMLQAYLPLELRPYRDAFAYSAVLLILLLRPEGLIVERTAKERV